MKKIAYIFPGQGAHYVGMGKDLYMKSSLAYEVFEQANVLLGFDLARLCFEGPADRLAQTENSQPAIFTLSIALFRTVEKELPPASALAGLSLGEYSALTAGGAISFEQGLCLVRKRGEFMQSASKSNPGRMVCVIGLPRKDIEEIAQQSGVEIANLNCPGQIVLSGTTESIRQAIELAKKKGAKRTIMLEVSGAFHSSLMRPAKVRLEKEIQKVNFCRPSVPLVSNVSADYTDTPEIIKADLIKQIDHPTYWEDSIRRMIKDGIDTFFEIGPGQTLKGILRRIDPTVEVVSVG